MSDLMAFNGNAQMQNSTQQGGVLAHSSASREMEEVKGAIFLAKQFPRNYIEAERRILDACKRPSLAASAMYSYPRGGTKVTGPSIRLAEVLAQNWGNLSYGIKELEQREGESIAMAYCWDLETNVRQEKVFTVKHAIGTKNGLKKLTDPRDIYERVASDGARRLRACILGVIPGDVVEMAVKQCEETLRGNADKPLKERVSDAIKLFKEKYKVTQEMIEAKFGYNVSAFTEIDLIELGKIFNSLKDGMTKPEDWFDMEIGKKSTSNALVEGFKETQQKEEQENDVPTDK